MRKEDLTEQFVQTIKERIFRQVYAIGEALPSHRQLALDFGYSRSVINVGIARLVSEGYLVVLARQKTLVNNFIKTPNLTILKDLAFYSDTPYKKRVISDILVARKLIEVESVRLAAEGSVSTLRLKEIISIEQQLLDKGNLDYVEVAKYDFEFHNQLVEMSQNLVYTSLINAFSEIAKSLTQIFYKNRIDLFDYYVQAHKNIEKSIQNREVDSAVTLLKEILEHGEAAYMF